MTRDRPRLEIFSMKQFLVGSTHNGISKREKKSFKKIFQSRLKIGKKEILLMDEDSMLMGGNIINLHEKPLATDLFLMSDSSKANMMNGFVFDVS